MGCLPGRLQRPQPSTARGPRTLTPREGGGLHLTPHPEALPPPSRPGDAAAQSLGTRGRLRKSCGGRGQANSEPSTPIPRDQEALKLHRKRGQAAGTRPGSCGSPQRHIVREGRLRRRAHWAQGAQAVGPPRKAAGPAARGWPGHAAVHSPAPARHSARPGLGSAPSAPPPPPGPQT